MFAGLRLRQLSKTTSPMYSLLASKPVHMKLNMLRYFGSIVNIKLPDLGEGTKEATLKEWFVKKGSEINEFEDLCEVFTDKLVAQIPSTHKGIINKIYFKQDDVCPVGSILADIEVLEEGETPSQAKETSQEQTSDDTSEDSSDSETSEETATNQAYNSTDKALATPVTRFYAKKLGVDIHKVKGSGKNGRVINKDVDRYLQGAQSESKIKSPSQKTQSSKPAVKQDALRGVIDKDQVKKITAIKKGMTKTMTEGLSIPSFSYQDEYNCSDLMKLRKEFKEFYKDLTLLPFFIKSISLSLSKNPGMNINVNPEVDDDGYIYEYVIKHDHNIAVAVDSVNGLVVPVLKKVQEKSILEINQELLILRKRAEEGKLTKEDYEDGTFSVSSVGNLGGTSFVPTILRPQGSIVAIGKAKKKAHYVETNEKGHVFVPIDSIWFSFSCDHRVIDGATCARFSEDIRKLIENPRTMLLNMR